MAAAVAWLLAVPAAGWAAAGPAAHPAEAVKAAFLFNFARFVEWPAESFHDEESPLVIGVLGDGAFAEELRRSVGDRRIHRHPIEVRVVVSGAEARGTHLLFVRSSYDHHFPEIRAEVATLAVLTVGESRSFARQGGTITFVVEGDHLRFAIDMTSADRAGLRISAQLQKLATSVSRRR